MIGARGSGRRSTPEDAAILETLRADVAAAEGPQIKATEESASKAFATRRGAKPDTKTPPAKSAKKKRGSK